MVGVDHIVGLRMAMHCLSVSFFCAVCFSGGDAVKQKRDHPLRSFLVRQMVSGIGLLSSFTSPDMGNRPSFLWQISPVQYQIVYLTEPKKRDLVACETSRDRMYGILLPKNLPSTSRTTSVLTVSLFSSLWSGDLFFDSVPVLYSTAIEIRFNSRIDNAPNGSHVMLSIL